MSTNPTLNLLNNSSDSYLFSLFHCVECWISLDDFPLLDDLVEAQQSALHFRCNLSQVGQSDGTLFGQQPAIEWNREWKIQLWMRKKLIKILF